MVGFLPRVEHMVGAFRDEGGSEGLCAIQRKGVWIPLISADAEREQWITEQAEIIARTMGIKVVVARFSLRTDLKTFDFSS